MEFLLLPPILTGGLKRLLAAQTIYQKRNYGMKNIYYSLTIALSLFVIVSCSTESTPVYQLTTSVEPTEAGSVSPSAAEYDEGASVNITATPNEHWVFDSWQGGHTGKTNPASVTINGDKDITALFIKRDYPLTVNTEGEGVVEEKVVQQKSTDYEHETIVELTAVADEGWKFVRWEGDAEGSENPATIEIDGEKIVTAVFERRDYPLTVNIVGEGTVTEEVVQGKTTDYPFETIVELTASPSDGWEFVEWQGDTTGSENLATLTVDEAKDVTAVFERKDYPLTLNIEGEGTVAEEVVQAKTTDYPFETIVELTASPSDGWEFVEWQGDLTGSDNSATITVDDAKEVTAVFKRLEYTVNTSVDGEGIITINPEQNVYFYGDEIIITVEPTDGWNFVYWDGDIEGSDNPITVTVEFDISVTANLDNSPFAGGNGSELYPYQVSTVEQLQEIINYTDKHFVQINDIDANATSTWNGGLGFKPIGDEIVRFRGLYDGNNKNIFSFFIERPSEEYVGLFGYVEKAIVKNISFINTKITGGNSVGGLVGAIYDSEIIDVHISGDISVDGINSNVGGLIGAMVRSEVKNSSSDGAVKGSSRAGGLIGYSSGGIVDSSHSNSKVDGDISAGGLLGGISSNGSILNSFATGNVSSSRDINSGRTGGLVAQNWDSSIINSYATGNVSGSSYMIGGLVGNNRGSIQNSFSDGDVSGEKEMVGGFVGQNSEDSVISNSYSTGNVVGNKEVGGFVGLNRNDAKIKSSFSVGTVTGQKDIGGFVGVNGAFVESSYWDTDSSNQTNGLGRGSSTGITGLTTSEITGTSAEENMPEFDWDEIWITTDGYPKLRWHE